MDYQTTIPSPAELGAIDAALAHLAANRWLYAAIVLSPLAAYRLVQWYKNDYRANHNGVKPPARRLATANWMLCFAISMYCLAQYLPWSHRIAFWCAIIATLSTYAIRYILSAGDNSDKDSKLKRVATAIRGEIYTDDRTALQTVIGAAVGAKVVQDRRHADGAHQGHDRRE